MWCIAVVGYLPLAFGILSYCLHCLQRLIERSPVLVIRQVATLA